MQTVGRGRALHVITEKALKVFRDEHPTARLAMDSLARSLRQAHWSCLEDVRATFPHADEVKVKSRRSVTVLNVGGNNWRLVVAFHYDRQKVFILKVMTHAEYAREKRKQTL
jgi:mRNA interferase HigB